MDQKLLIAIRLLWMNFLESCREIYHFSILKSIAGKASLLMLFILISINGYGQQPFIQNFEGGFPSGWLSLNNTTGTTAWTTSTDGYLSTGAAYVNPTADNIGAGNTARYYLITPSIKVPVNGKIKFFTKQSSAADNGTVYEIRLSTTNPSNLTGFGTLLTSWTEAQLNPTNPLAYEEKVVNIPSDIAPGIDVYVAFVLVNHQTGPAPTVDTWFIDNINIASGDPVIACPFVASNYAVKAGTYNISVTPNATVGNQPYEVQVVPAGTPRGESGTVVSGPYNHQGLNPLTAYDVYLRAVCNGSSASNWTNTPTYTVTTKLIGYDCAGAININSQISNNNYTRTDNIKIYGNRQEPPFTDVYPLQGGPGTVPAIQCSPDGFSNYVRSNRVYYTYTAPVKQVADITVTNLNTTTNLNNHGVYIFKGCTSVAALNCMGGRGSSATGPKVYSDFVMEAGETYIFVVGHSTNSDIDVNLKFDFKIKDCVVPIGFSTSKIKQTEVTISWINTGNVASSWNVFVQPTGLAAPTTETGVPATTNTNYIVNGTFDGQPLLPGTSYDVYVKANCAGGSEAWSLAHKITTLCAPAQLPYQEDFTGGTLTNVLPCWNSINLASAKAWDYQLPGEPSLFTSNAVGANHDFFVSPIIHIPAGGAPKILKFDAKANIATSGGNPYSQIKVKASTVGYVDNDASLFNITILPTTNVTSNSYTTISVQLPSTIVGDYQFAWVVEPGMTDTGRITIDNVIIGEQCDTPTALAANNIGITSADLSWNGGTADKWHIIVQPLGGPVPGLFKLGTLVENTASYTDNDLLSGTRYEYYVRTICTAGSSTWAGPFPFTTLCDTYNVPYEEGFNTADVVTKKFCWTATDVDNNGINWTMTATNVTLNAVQTSQDLLISPKLNLTGYHQVKLKHRRASGTGSYQLEFLLSGTDTDPASFTTVINSQTGLSNSALVETIFYFNFTGVSHIAIRAKGMTGNVNVAIDDFKIFNSVSCPKPINLAVTNVTANTADFAWGKGNQEDEWEVVILPFGSQVPTSGTVVNTLTYPITQLLPATQYSAYVRGICDTNLKSDWTGPFVFTTACTEIFNVPFIETFNTGSVSENCWTHDPTRWLLDNTMVPFEGDQAALLYTYYTGSWLISPTINITGGQKRLRFHYRTYGGAYQEDLNVKMSTSGIAQSSFTTTLYNSFTQPIPYINNTEYKELVVNLPAGTTGNINIAFEVPPKYTSLIYMRQHMYIDSVIIEDLPACPEPTNIQIAETGDTFASVTFDSDASVTQWQVVVLPYGTTFSESLMTPANTFLSSTKPVQLSGLTPATKYEYYIRPVCTSGNGIWSQGFEFTTRCSFENICEYVITVVGGPFSGISGSINVMQNGVVVSELTALGGALGTNSTFNLFLCQGVEFSLYWDSIGWAPGTSGGSELTIKKADGTVVWVSPLGFGTPKTTIYTGIANCGPVTCPQPTSLQALETGNLTWTAGGTETQWEVSIQPVGNGTLPQSGTLVSANSYTPLASDFVNGNAATYEYFVRAVCGTGNASYWSGPRVFVRNDAASTALTLTVSANENCTNKTKVSFSGATPSTVPNACNINNGADIWLEFDASAATHLIELSNFSGKYWDGGFPELPEIVMALYHENTDGSLTEVKCSKNNVLSTLYSKELIVGDAYKLRLILENTLPNNYTFDVCVSTITDPCSYDTPNYSFEKIPLQEGTIVTYFTLNEVIPGWRNSSTGYIFYYTTENIIYPPFDGGQFIQLTNTTGEVLDLNNVKGMYQDFDSSEVTQYDYSFVHAGRGGAEPQVVELYAGPPQGPFVLIKENLGAANWVNITGKYNVPAGQDVTRFVFRSKNNVIGNILDAINFKPFNGIITSNQTLPCVQTSIDIKAEGVGTWIADAANPAATIISNVNSKSISVSGFNTPGVYKYKWKTRYCESVISITYQGYSDVPTVTTPVEYCINTVPVALEATPMANYTLKWFTQEVGGTGTTTVPTPDTSLAGTAVYYVSHVDQNGCEGPRVAITVVVNAKAIPVVGFAYDATEYCTAGANPVIALDNGFATGGTFTATPVGLTIDAATGAIDITQSTPGVYEVVYNLPEIGCAEAGTTMVQVTVIQSVTPVTGFSYDASYCTGSANPVPVLDPDFYTGGTFSAATGLSINPVTGEIDLAASTAGTYNVMYKVTAGQCISEESTIVSVTIITATNAVVDFSYEGPVCIDSTDELTPILASNFTVGGTFSSTTLTVDTQTGTIDMSTAIKGIHEVTYTIVSDADNCMTGGTFIATIELVDEIVPVTEFTYESSYCNNSANALPQLSTGFTQGGVFSATGGLAINAATGEINISDSKPGTYVITYTVAPDAATCNKGDSYEYTITIAADYTAVITEDCIDQQLWLHATVADGSGTVNYVWKNETGAVVGTDSADFNMSEYYASNPNLELPLILTVTTGTGSCTTVAEYTVTSVACLIPRGISPNGDGNNDTFDLSNMGVKELTIFNRYGKDVYHYKGNYANQWSGQQNNGNELPTGTYFYTIYKVDGSSVTGWVYINRER